VPTRSANGACELIARQSQLYRHSCTELPIRCRPICGRTPVAGRGSTGRRLLARAAVRHVAWERQESPKRLRLAAKVAENPVAFSDARQTGDFGRQPFDDRRTPLPTPIGDYRVLPVITQIASSARNIRHSSSTFHSAVPCTDVAKIRTSDEGLRRSCRCRSYGGVS
jgi:hypothetical protein